MPCPDPRHCPQLVNGRCMLLLGTSTTHSKIRRDCDHFGRVPEAIVTEGEDLKNCVERPAPRCRNNGGIINCGGRPEASGRCALCGRASGL